MNSDPGLLFLAIGWGWVLFWMFLGDLTDRQLVPMLMIFVVPYLAVIVYFTIF